MATTPADHDGWRPGGEFWGGLRFLLHRRGPWSAHLDPGNALKTQQFMRDVCRVLVIGAGGLGCELLKDLALSGFRFIDVVDLDTIDVTNLNRQFLFRKNDVGKSKAIVAAQFINSRVPGVCVTPHHGNIMDFDDEFYKQFHFVVAGLDSVDARRWLNALLIDSVDVDDDGQPDTSTIIPLIDGGTEGFQGQARVIIPRMTSCFECTLGLFPPAKTYPLCTIANTPRLPEHCIEYANVVEWPRQSPFGQNVKPDLDNPDHAAWLFREARKRADEFGIQGVTYRLTQGVAKNIIPAVASSNAIIAAACANEALKLATRIADSVDNYMMYNGNSGVYSFTYRNERRSDCPVCGKPVPRVLKVDASSTLSEFLEFVAADAELRSRNPLLRTAHGKTLYASTPPDLRKVTSVNLEKKMSELISDADHTILLNDRDLSFTHTLVLTLG